MLTIMLYSLLFRSVLEQTMRCAVPVYAGVLCAMLDRAAVTAAVNSSNSFYTCPYERRILSPLYSPRAFTM